MDSRVLSDSVRVKYLFLPNRDGAFISPEICVTGAYPIASNIANRGEMSFERENREHNALHPQRLDTVITQLSQTRTDLKIKLAQITQFSKLSFFNLSIPSSRNFYIYHGPSLKSQTNMKLTQPFQIL